MPKINPRIKSIDDLLGLDAAEESPIEPTPSVSLPTKNTIITLPPQAIRAFRGHPFRLYEGDRLNDLVESISEHGVLNPAIIRKIERDEDGFEYEMLAGHNRQNAAAIANRELPCIVKENLSDEDAWIYVIETNVLQRSFSEMLPSEKAAVLTLRYSKMICQGRRNDIVEELKRLENPDEIRENGTCGIECHKSKSRDVVGAEYDLKGRAVANYLRINELITPLKRRIDDAEFPIVVAVQLSYLTEQEQQIMADFILRAEAIRTGRVKPEEDNMLKLTGEARLMAIDPRLIRPDADGTGSKLSVCIEDVYQVWKDTAASASTQLVFCDVGTPKAGKFNVYDEIRNVLLAKGVPESEIAFVHDATSEAQRQELFERTRQGKVRILIGSTSKLGTGVNVQNKVISIDHLDCPWKPSDITQRNGRGVRQGNENPEIMIKQFVAKGTFDAYLWQIQEQKLRYITQILTGKHIARSCEDVDETVLSAAQFKAAATDNPMVAQKMELENRVTELKILRGAWSNEQLSLERKISTIYPGQIKRYEKEIDQIGEDIKLLNQSAGSDFSIVLDGKRYTERSEAGEAFGLLYRMIKEGAKDDSEEFEIGAYRSFPLYLSVGYVSRLVLRYNHHYTTEVGTSALGAITRIEHLAERIPGYLKEAQRELEEVQKQLAVAQQQVGQPFIYEDELSEKVAQLTEINTKLEFESLQESEVILDENGQRSDGEEDWDSERVPSCASAEV